MFTAHTGDLLSFSDGNNYSVTFDAIDIDPEWNLDNCRIAAFVHKMDKVDMAQNEVLNAAQKWITAMGAIEDVELNSDKVRFIVNDNRTITVQGNVESYRIYNMQGQYISNNTCILPGVYVVTYKTLSGERGATKLLVH